jgi:adenylylsulfate kinase
MAIKAVLFGLQDYQVLARRLYRLKLKRSCFNEVLVDLVPMISPTEAARDMIRQRFHSEEYAEIYVKCSLETCERRDPKGLYHKARSGEILDFTGINSIYEPPLLTELTIDTEHNSMEKCVISLIEFVIHRYTNVGTKERTI